MKYLFSSLLLLLQATAALASEAAAQDDKGFWYAQTSLYTRHFSPYPKHNNNQELIDLERNEASGLVYGGATFRNSFSQRSYYVYAGKRYDIADSPLYVKVTAGALKRYHGKYRDKIPLNRFGVAPVIIPSVGVNFGPVASELLGFNAAMLTAGLRF